jgi:VWFA-related protein
VPVVVRDSSGHAVGTLQKQDFQLFDNHKIQELAQFTVEKADRTGPSDAVSAGPDASAPKIGKFVAPVRFTAILFDDVHSTFDNLPQLQSASLHLVSNALAPAERLAIFITSGKLVVDFTDDRAKLQDALKKLKPNPLPGSQTKECADISHYDANQIVNRHDLATRNAAVSQTMDQCGIKDPKMALEMVLETSERVLRIGDVETQLVLRALAGTIDRLSTLPGQRSLILASPSFLVSDREHREYELVDRAIRSHIVISTLDTRGLYTDENEVADSNVLSAFANGTGGVFFHNSNDLTEGLRRLASPPEFVYELGFSPKDLAENGK